MGIMTTRDLEQNSELNRRISADLRQRVQTNAMGLPDYDKEEEFVKNTKKTGRFTWIWIVLVVLAIISLVCIAFI